MWDQGHPHGPLMHVSRMHVPVQELLPFQEGTILPTIRWVVAKSKAQKNPMTSVSQTLRIHALVEVARTTLDLACCLSKAENPALSSSILPWSMVEACPGGGASYNRS